MTQPPEVCHTKSMENETLSPALLAFIDELAADLDVPLDFDPDDEVEPMGRFDGYPVF